MRRFHIVQCSDHEDVREQGEELSKVTVNEESARAREELLIELEDRVAPSYTANTLTHINRRKVTYVPQ